MELKVYHCNEWHNEYTEFYLKNEAEICLNHQRQKRCEALADKCLVLMMLCADKNQTDKSNFYKKWYITWSKLARQFKESYIWKM